MNYFLPPAVIFFIMVLSACSTSETTKQTESASNSDKTESVPVWYHNEMKADQSTYFGYGVAIAADSTEAKEIAIDVARKNLEAGLSEILESVRLQANEVNNDNAEWNSPEFILALRKTENVIAKSVSLSRKDIRKSKQFSSYRAYAEVSISKTRLIDRMTEAFPGNKSVWESFTRTKAFLDM